MNRKRRAPTHHNSRRVSIRLFFEGKEGEEQEEKEKNKHRCSGLGLVISCHSRRHCLQLMGKSRVRAFKTSGADLKTSWPASYQGEDLLPEKKGKRKAVRIQQGETAE